MKALRLSPMPRSRIARLIPRAFGRCLEESRWPNGRAAHARGVCHTPRFPLEYALSAAQAYGRKMQITVSERVDRRGCGKSDPAARIQIPTIGGRGSIGDVRRHAGQALLQRAPRMRITPGGTLPARGWPQSCPSTSSTRQRMEWMSAASSRRSAIASAV